MYNVNSGLIYHMHDIQCVNVNDLPRNPYHVSPYIYRPPKYERAHDLVHYEQQQSDHDSDEESVSTCLIREHNQSFINWRVTESDRVRD